MNKVLFLGEQCEVEIGRYQVGTLPYVALYCESGELMTMATVNIPGANIPDGCVLVKDYSENTGMLVALQEAGIVGSPVAYVNSGYVQIPACPLLVEVS